MKWRQFLKRFKPIRTLNYDPSPNPKLKSLPLQQQRGVAISADAWKSAVEHAERLVVLAENKLERRQSNSYAYRIAKLQVNFLPFNFVV